MHCPECNSPHTIAASEGKTHEMICVSCCAFWVLNPGDIVTEDEIATAEAP